MVMSKVAWFGYAFYTFMEGQSTSKRQLSSVRIMSMVSKMKVASYGAKAIQPTHGRIELDSHANTVVLGNNCVILSYTGKECEVSPYTETYESVKNVPIVMGATAWTRQEDGQTFILVFHEALWMGDAMSHSLLNQNQMRSHGMIVQDNPFSGSMFAENYDSDLRIPFQADGTVIYADTRTPTAEELDTCQHVICTAPGDWDPRNVQFPYGLTTDEGHRVLSAIHVDQSIKGHYDYDDDPMTGSIYDENISTRRILAQVDVDYYQQDVPVPKTFQSKGRHSSVTPADLSERWNITLARAKATLEATTQKFLWSAVLPLGRRYRA